MPELCNNTSSPGCYLYSAMKKLLVLFLLTLYMGSSTGATFSMHYCKGRLVAVEMADVTAAHCPKCGGEEKGECCKSEHRTVKLEKDQKPVENTHNLLPAAIPVLPVSFMMPLQMHPLTTVTDRSVCHAPPEGHKVHPVIFHCTFRI